MQYTIKFGTDGWRGVIAEDYTFDNVRRAAQGFASYLLEQGRQGQWVVVGYDKRFASERFAGAVAEVLVANGLNVYLTNGATPTPVIAYAVVNKKACGAVNITASHNPPTDNGFKVRNEFGGAIDPAGLTRIEALIPNAADASKAGGNLGDQTTNRANLSNAHHVTSLSGAVTANMGKFANTSTILAINTTPSWAGVQKAGLGVITAGMDCADCHTFNGTAHNW